MIVNQRGEEVTEETLFGYVGDTLTAVSDQDRDDAIALICQHLGIRIVRTNATKHGNTQLVLQTEE